MLWNDAKCGAIGGGGPVRALAVCKRPHIPAAPTPPPTFPPLPQPGGPQYYCTEKSRITGRTDGKASCYMYFNNKLKRKMTAFKRHTWFGAAAFCKENAAALPSFARGVAGATPQLASISSTEENDFVKKVIYDCNEEIASRCVLLVKRSCVIVPTLCVRCMYARIRCPSFFYFALTAISGSTWCPSGQFGWEQNNRTTAQTRAGNGRTEPVFRTACAVSFFTKVCKVACGRVWHYAAVLGSELLYNEFPFIVRLVFSTEP